MWLTLPYILLHDDLCKTVHSLESINCAWLGNFAPYQQEREEVCGSRKNSSYNNVSQELEILAWISFCSFSCEILFLDSTISKILSLVHGSGTISLSWLLLLPLFLHLSFLSLPTSPLLLPLSTLSPSLLFLSLLVFCFSLYFSLSLPLSLSFSFFFLFVFISASVWCHTIVEWIHIYRGVPQEIIIRGMWLQRYLYICIHVPGLSRQ